VVEVVRDWEEFVHGIYKQLGLREKDVNKVKLVDLVSSVVWLSERGNRIDRLP
jgi:hypothetical protein